MPGIQLSQLAAANGAQLRGATAEVRELVIDSRQASEGSLFVAIAGSRVDGHGFVQDAAERGAVGVVVERRQDVPIAQIVVADSAKALAVVARCNRERFDGAVVAITGSVGKTTCKNMLESIVSQSSQVCATRGNLNNELGVPLTLQRLSAEDDVAIVEMGAAQQGDIAYLTEIAQPQIAVVTAVSEAHIGRFGSLENTALAKGEIYDQLPGGGTAVINRDDDFAEQWRKQVCSLKVVVSIVEYSIDDARADVYATDIQQSEQGVAFVANIKRDSGLQRIPVQMLLPGRHNVGNALAAIAIASCMQIAVEDIQAGLRQLIAEPGRLNRVAGRNGLEIIDDSYNASPQAVRAAIDVLTTGYSLAKRSLVLVLGDMAELGERSAQLHFQIGQYAAQCGVDYLMACGVNAEQYVAGYQASVDADGCDAVGSAEIFVDKSAIVDALLDKRFASARVLVKGSRAAAMDEVVGLLAESNSETESGGSPC